MVKGGELVHHVSPAIYLALITALAVVYSKRRSIVILPALMIGSLIGRFAGLVPPNALMNIAELAVALLVFIAGLELDVDFIRNRMGRMVFTAFLEITLLLSLFDVFYYFFSPPVALTLISIILASNEAFVLEFKRKRGRDLAMYGVTLSVIEDSLAIAILSMGLLTTGALEIRHFLLFGEEGISLIVWGTAIFLVSLLASRLLVSLMRSVDVKEAKILVCLLYIFILIAVSEALNLPEAIVVFLGSVALALHRLEREVFEALENYMILALMGFVMSLPYMVKGALRGGDILVALALGVGLGIAAFVTRFTIVFVSSIVTGFSLEEAGVLALSLANTGEFGLIVLSSLIGRGLIPPILAYSAMFAYSFNLTLVSELVKRADRLGLLVKEHLSGPFLAALERFSHETGTLMGQLYGDREFGAHVFQLVQVVALTYLMAGARVLMGNNQAANYLVSIVQLSALILAIYVSFERISRDLSRVRYTGRSIVLLVLRMGILYVVLVPVLRSLEAALRGGTMIELSSPLTIVLVFVSSYLLQLLTDRVSAYLMKDGPAPPGGGQAEEGPGHHTPQVGQDVGPGDQGV